MIRPMSLLDGRSLVGNTAWNLFGMLLPLLVAVGTIPVLIDKMGTERFGLLSIVWMAVGYFSLFDFGIGRALTKLVAERLGTKQEIELSNLIGTALTLMWGLGFAAALVVALLSPWLTTSVLDVPEALRFEALWSFWILAAALPFVIAAAGLIGIMEARQQFRHIAWVRIPLGISNFVGPLLILTFSQSLIAITTFVAVSRVVAWLSFWKLSGARLDADGSKLNPASVRALISFGGWLTVTNIVGPVMVYFDRFLIGAVLGLTAVTYYTTPYEVITRLWVLPQAIMGVLFPAFAASLSVSPEQASRLFRVAAQVLLYGMAAPLGLIILFAPEALDLWLGKAFAGQSTELARWLALGVYINCLARLPFIALQSQGRPDLTAALHVGELMLYLPVLWWLIARYGILGAAVGWTLRIIVDTVALFWLSGRLIPALKKESRRSLILTTCAACGLGLLWLPSALSVKLMIALALITVCIAFLWALLRHHNLFRSATGSTTLQQVRS